MKYFNKELLDGQVFSRVDDTLNYIYQVANDYTVKPEYQKLYQKMAEELTEYYNERFEEEYDGQKPEGDISDPDFLPF